MIPSPTESTLVVFDATDFLEGGVTSDATGLILPMSGAWCVSAQVCWVLNAVDWVDEAYYGLGYQARILRRFGSEVEVVAASGATPYYVGTPLTSVSAVLVNNLSAAAAYGGAGDRFEVEVEYGHGGETTIESPGDPIITALEVHFVGAVTRGNQPAPPS